MGKWLHWHRRGTDALVNRGIAHLRRGELEEAERILSECLEEDPSSIKALEGIAEVALRRGEGERYLRLSNQILTQPEALSSACRVTLCHRQADVCLERLDAPQRAIEALARIELDYPGSADAVRARRRIEQIVSQVERQERL